LPFNGSGVFVRLYNWVSDRNAGIPITASRFDGEDDDFAAGLSQCLTRDGQGAPAGPINMNNFKITNVADATSPTDAMNARSVINDLGVWGTSVGGTANAQTVNTAITGVPLQAGQRVNYIPTTANTGATTLSVNGGAAKSIFFLNHALTGGELGPGIKAELVYDGTNFQLVSVPANYTTGGGGGGIPEAPNTAFGYAREALGWTSTPNFQVGATMSADPTAALGIATKGYVDAQVGGGQLIAVRPFSTSQTPYVPSGGTNSIAIILQGPGAGGGGVPAAAAGQQAIASAGGAGETRWAIYSGSSNITGQNLVLPAGGAGGAAGSNPGTQPADATFGTSSLPGGQLVAAAGHGGAAGSLLTYTNDFWAGNSTQGGNSGNAGYASMPGGYGSPTLVTGNSAVCCRGGSSYFAPSPAPLIVLIGAGPPTAHNATNWGGGGDGALAMQGSGAMAGGTGGGAFALIFEYS